jgi:hypothetical protein
VILVALEALAGPVWIGILAAMIIKRLYDHGGPSRN